MLAALIFVTGNTRIVVMENFEALGKYTAASEQAAKFRDQRDGALSNISDLTRRFGNETVVSTECFARNFDPAMLRQYMDVAATAHQNLLQAIEEANTHAESCNRGKLKIQG